MYIFMLFDIINFVVCLLDSNGGSLVCLAAVSLCRLLLWEAYSQLLITALANATDASIFSVSTCENLNSLVLKHFN